MKIDAKFITHMLYRTYCQLSDDVVSNIYFHDNFESDFIRVSKAGYVQEIEVKISVSDFRADFKKSARKWNREMRDYEEWNKHEIISKGTTGLKHFWFATPQGLLDHSLIPKHCGLIEVDERGTLREVIRSPQLKGFVKIANVQQNRINNKYKWSFYNLRREAYQQTYSDTLKHFREQRMAEND